MKQCNKCSEFKDKEKFSLDKRLSDGLRSTCKSCVAENSRKYYSANKEARKAYNKKWYENNPDKARAARENWRSNNYDKALQSSRNWRSGNLEKAKEATRNWSRKNLDKRSAYENIRRSRKLSNGIYYISGKEIEKLYSSPCYYCGSLSSITIDHVVPISKGGRHSIGNLVSCCKNCNSSKKDKLLIQWKIGGLMSDKKETPKIALRSAEESIANAKELMERGSK